MSATNVESGSRFWYVWDPVTSTQTIHGPQVDSPVPSDRAHVVDSWPASRPPTRNDSQSWKVWLAWCALEDEGT